jgi:hypothetical protein
MNQRLNVNLSFFQVDFTVTPQAGIIDPGPEITDQALQQLEDSGTNAGLYWTMYDFEHVSPYKYCIYLSNRYCLI